MKPYQKALLVLVITLVCVKTFPKIYNFLKGEPPVKRGQVWRISTRVIPFENNQAQKDVLVRSDFLILSVDEDGNVKAFSRGDTIDMHVREFTFNSDGWSSSLVKDVDPR